MRTRFLQSVCQVTACPFKISLNCNRPCKMANNSRSVLLPATSESVKNLVAINVLLPGPPVTIVALPKALALEKVICVADGGVRMDRPFSFSIAVLQKMSTSLTGGQSVSFVNQDSASAMHSERNLVRRYTISPWDFSLEMRRPLSLDV